MDFETSKIEICLIYRSSWECKIKHVSYFCFLITYTLYFTLPKSLIKEFVLDYYKEDIAEISDGRKRAGYIRRRNNYIYKLLTNLVFTLEDDESENDGFLLWDWDYSLFSEYGFYRTLDILRSEEYGCQRGYGPEYVKEMLTLAI